MKISGSKLIKIGELDGKDILQDTDTLNKVVDVGACLVPLMDQLDVLEQAESFLLGIGFLQVKGMANES